MRGLWNTLTVILLLVTLVIGGINCNNKGFWVVSAGQLLTPLCAICLTFFAAQLKTDQRETKKHAEALVEKIQGIVMDANFGKIPATISEDEKKNVQQQILMTNRKLNNSISYLVVYGEKLGFTNEADYIKTQFSTYRSLIDENINDFSELAKLKTRFKKHAENIDSKCDEIVVKLYS